MSLKALLNHFGFSAHPFTRGVPDGALLLHRSFTEALGRLRLSLESRTAAILTAEPGLGKSILLGALSDELDQETSRVVYTPLSSCGPFGLIGQLAMRYGTKPKRSAAQTAQVLLDEFAKSSRQEVLILDEAHLLPRATLDELRLLGNLNFDRTPPFTLILAGQPPLREHLADPDLESLWQRLAIRSALAPLTEAETTDYVQRRLRAVGCQVMLFRPPVMERLFEQTKGVPREINNIATAALLGAATAGRKHVDPKDMEAAIFEHQHA